MLKRLLGLQKFSKFQRRKQFGQILLWYVNIFFILYAALFYHFLLYIGPKKRFSHRSKIGLCTTKEFFLIEPIKICADLNNENEYLCLQLNCLNEIKYDKNHFLCLKLIFLLFRGYNFKPKANSKQSRRWSRILLGRVAGSLQKIFCALLGGCEGMLPQKTFKI